MLKKITVNDPPMPSHLNQSVEAYCNKNQFKLKKFQIYFVSSNNDFAWTDIDNCRQDLNYVPQDGAHWN
ncbi:unnamed protein product [Rotaria sordida]|nr:unnamed protein product [Rotaria sordida]